MNLMSIFSPFPRRRWVSACTALTRVFAFTVVAAPATAQMIQPIPGSIANDPIDTLSMHLRTLAANPRNLSALLGAGQAAIDVGDPNAALGFFARADEIDPRSGKAKAGLAKPRRLASPTARSRATAALPMTCAATTGGRSVIMPSRCVAGPMTKWYGVMRCRSAFRGIGHRR
jgi:hypothetical protein